MITQTNQQSFCSRLFPSNTAASRGRFRASSAAFALVGLLLSGAVAQAQVPVNQLYFPLVDAGPGTTTASSTALGGLNVTLTMYNGSGAAVNLHGLAGSGVNGLATGAMAMCLTNGDTGSATKSANANAASDSTVDLGDAALALGTVTNFVATMWINEPIEYSDASGNTLPRLFVLSTGGSPGAGEDAANSIGVKFQLGNQFELVINNATTTTGNSYNAPANTATLGTTLTSDMLPNKWYFVAWVYDGTNIYQYTGSDTAVATLQNQLSAPGLSVNLGNPSTLVLGNKTWKGSRGFFGWMEDFRFYTGTSTNNASFVESIRKAIAPKIPTLSSVPDGTALMQGTNTFTFTASSSSGFNLTNFTLSVNSVNVSAGLTFVTNGTPGTSTNVTASYTGLPQQTIVTAVMGATDGLGLTGTSSVTFDTYSPTNFFIKAEEFDFGGGQFLPNPDYTDGNPSDANSYYGLSSIEGIDTHKGPGVGDNPTTDYRYDGDTPAGADTQTPVAAGELTLPRVVNAPLDGSGNPQQNHMIANWSSGEWQNYTRVFPAGNYNVYARLSTASGSTVVFSQVTGGQGTSSQTLNQLGTFTFSGAGFHWVPLMANGTLAVVNLAGTHTVRATTGGGANADLYMFLPANPNLPVISNVKPNGSVLFQSTNTLSFTATSPTTTISTNNIQVMVNGVNVASSLVFSGGPSTWNVSYSGLLPNQTYVVTINVTDANSGTANASLTIDTWNPIVQFEAEDFDFDPAKSPVSDVTGFRFIDNPVPTSIATATGVYQITSSNSYEGQTGDESIDQFGVGAGTRVYRPGDVATTVVTDTPRAQFAGRQDFNVGFLGAGFWEDYTRTWPAGTYNIYGRMASGASQSGLPTPPGIRDDFNQIVAGAGTTNQVLSYVGTFNIPTTNGYSAYSYIPLIDRFGNYANVTMSGVETFRSTLDLTTTAGLPQFGLNVNFYMLTAPRTDLPRIDNVYPDALMQPSGAFTFVASSPTYGINTSNVVVTLNGVNVSSNLVFRGSPSSWNVSYPGLQPNTSYTATISITDSNNQTHATTVSFDTFNPNNFTWEAEDFDFNGGQFIDNPTPTSVPATNSYFGQTGTSDIDEAAAWVNFVGTYTYRINDLVSTEVTSDTLRQKYVNAQVSQVNPLITDYDVFHLTNGYWLNYTRTFPAGNYNVYGRLLPVTNGPFSLQCLQVTSGAGTSTQVTQPLGSFVGTGTGWQYVPLVNPNTGVPVVVSFSGVETLQISGDGNENANFFMLVGPTAPVLTATLSSPNVLLSFQTQAGFHYTIYYKNNLTDPTWTILPVAGNPVVGNGAIESVSDTLGQGHRFYLLGVQ